MAKKKAKTNTKAKKTSQGSSGRGGILFSRPVRTFLLAVMMVALVYWQRETILAWLAGVWDGMVGLFGWGLVLALLAVGFFGGMMGAGRHASLIRRWNRWLGGAAVATVIWGVLALLGMGGSIGQGIIGSPGFLGGLRVAGLVLLSLVLLAPKASFRFSIRSVLWLRSRFKKPAAPEAVPKEAPEIVASSTAEKPMPEAVPQASAPREAEPGLSPLARAQKELRQVAEEVWKKYGESPNLVMVDGWRLPPMDILERIPEVEFSQADNMRRAKLIEEALASYGVETKITQINVGPTVTQFGVEPGWDRRVKEVREKDRDGNVTVRQEEVSRTRVKVERITSLANDLALALAAPSIRMEAPVPGKSVVGIEVPNTIMGLVSLRGVIETSPFQKLKAKAKLALALGKGAGGEAVIGDLTRMPHLLIAGATGSGKTVCLNAIICCLLMHNAPHEVKFILIDPKRVELTPFNTIPHLAAPVVVDTEKAVGTLRWLQHEMDKRYRQLAAGNARNIDAYNKTRQSEERMPYLVLIIDELADLMMTGMDEVETTLCRLAQMARATGIHLVVATQRPSVDVVTGLIKANFPTRISFAVTSQVDSRTILDTVGAEKLLGRGDMLYMPTEAAKPKRLQGCFVSDAELERLVSFWATQKKEEKSALGIEEFVTSSKGKELPPDPLLEAARKLSEEHQGRISTSFLQRHLRIGYPRAARIMEELEAEQEQGEEEETPPNIKG
ncbi:MAG: DNA translocase FtsK [Chloroflexota bacterium]